MTNRKKKILLAQDFIFIVAISLLFFTYTSKDEGKISPVITKNLPSNQEINKSKKNYFEDVEYKGIDLNGNRYVIESEVADFELDNPELINMKIMSATFYFKDGTILTVKGDYGNYNNITNDMEFRENIKAVYADNILFADNLDYLNLKNKITIYGNVKSESINGNIQADKLVFDLSAKTLDVSMFDQDKINVNIKN